MSPRFACLNEHSEESFFMNSVASFLKIASILHFALSSCARTTLVRAAALVLLAASRPQWSALASLTQTQQRASFSATQSANTASKRALLKAASLLLLLLREHCRRRWRCCRHASLVAPPALQPRPSLCYVSAATTRLFRSRTHVLSV